MTAPVFEMLNAITYTKNRECFSDKEYTPFIINRGLSQFPDTVFYAQEMNQRNYVDKDMQFAFLLNSIAKKRRFGKWAKKQKDENIELIMRYFDYNEQKARQALSLLTKAQLKTIANELKTGGKQ